MELRLDTSSRVDPLNFRTKGIFSNKVMWGQNWNPVLTGNSANH